MKYRLDPASHKKAYIQLYEALREDIVRGLFPYGKRLPSKRTLCEETGVSAVTVEHAYALLCEEGYAFARERSGYFCAFRQEDGFSLPAPPMRPHLTQTDEKKEGSFFPFSVLSKTMRRVLSEYDDRILVKSPSKGDPSFRAELCRYLGRSRGIEAEVEQIVVGAGAEYLYSLVLQLLGKDKRFGLEDPSYEKILRVYEALGAACVLLPLGPEGIRSEALKGLSADALHVTPYRSFPSGVTASASKKREYLRWAEGGKRYLVEDDFESEFTLSRKPEETLFAMTEKDNVIYVNTFSKTVSPSLRVGYMVLPKHLVKRFDEELGFYSCTAPLFEQLVLKELIAGGDFERHINRVRRKLREEKKS